MKHVFLSCWDGCDSREKNCTSGENPDVREKKLCVASHLYSLWVVRRSRKTWNESSPFAFVKNKQINDSAFHNINQKKILYLSLILKCYILDSVFLDCLWLTVIKEINVLRSFISDINDRLFSPRCFDVCRGRSVQGALWSPQTFYLPLFTLVKVLSGTSCSVWRM